MDHIHTGILLSEPQYRSCAWKLAFRIFRDPIQLIIAMRDRLTTDFRQNGLDFWTNDLRIYFKLLGESRDRIDQSLAILDTVAAFKTWDAGHRIRTAMSPVYTNLSLVESIFRNPADSPLVKAGIIRYPSFTAAELHSRLLDIRGRVFESSKKFCERPLLEELRRAMAEENHIELGVDRLNPREPKIVVPAVKDTYGDRADDDGHVEPVQADGTDVDDTSEKGMSPEEANEKGKMLVKERKSVLHDVETGASPANRMPYQNVGENHALQNGAKGRENPTCQTEIAKNVQPHKRTRICDR